MVLKFNSKQKASICKFIYRKSKWIPTFAQLRVSLGKRRRFFETSDILWCAQSCKFWIPLHIVINYSVLSIRAFGEISRIIAISPRNFANNDESTHTSHIGDDWPEVKFWPQVFALFGKVSTFMRLLPLWFSGIVVFFLAFTSCWSFPIKTDLAETNSGRYHLCGDWWLWLWLLLSLKIYFSWKFFGKCKKPFWSYRTLEKALPITRIMVNQLITGILKYFQFNEQNAY